MSRIRAKGNVSTELAVEARLRSEGIEGWVKHAKDVPGTPDFYFPDSRLALFVHGCFWHGCPQCDRNTPRTRREFWTEKIAANKKRDRRVRRQLWRRGYHVLRIWEHRVQEDTWLKRLANMMARVERED